MNMFRRYQARPWPATAVVAVILAAALLFVPVSYQKTVGQDATLTLAAPGMDLGQVKKIASEFKTALHAADLSVTQEAGRGPVLTARVPSRSTLPVARVAEAFAEGLTSRGIPSTVRVTPRVERVLGNVYAYARDNVINIQVTSDGKTPEQIAQEVQDQLQAAGIENPSVEYKKEGDRTALLITMGKPAAVGGDTTSCCPRLNITVDGRELGDDGTGQKRVEIRVRRTAGMTDEEVVADIQRQLREQGVDADVTMEDGQPVIHPRNP
jgi:hypothetical protein